MEVSHAGPASSSLLQTGHGDRQPGLLTSLPLGQVPMLVGGRLCSWPSSSAPHGPVVGRGDIPVYPPNWYWSLGHTIAQPYTQWRSQKERGSGARLGRGWVGASISPLLNPGVERGLGCQTGGVRSGGVPWLWAEMLGEAWLSIQLPSNIYRSSQAQTYSCFTTTFLPAWSRCISCLPSAIRWFSIYLLRLQAELGSTLAT